MNKKCWPHICEGSQEAMCGNTFNFTLNTLYIISSEIQLYNILTNTPTMQSMLCENSDG